MSNGLHHYITILDAADQTGLSYYFIRKLVLDGTVKSIRSGVKYFVDENSLADYLDSISGAEK